MLVGKAAVEQLKQCKVAIFGIGGVGSYVVEGLARAGIGHFVLVDSDTVCLSNINRQIIATHSTVGRPKVEVARERILDINPRAEVEIHQVFYLPENGESLVRPDMDYIVDAVDTVAAKIDLIVRAKALGIPVISCMGAGNKLDATRFKVADVFQTTYCPLSKVMRRELKKRGINSLKVVFSKEEPLMPQNPAADEIPVCDPATQFIDAPDQEPADASAQTTTAKAHRRVPGSVSFVPSVAGLIIAGEVFKDLIASEGRRA